MTKLEEKANYRTHALAVIEALMTPTPEMVEAGQTTECAHGDMNCGAEIAFKAMLSAAKGERHG